MEEPSPGLSRPMSQGGLSDWLKSRQSKASLDGTDEIKDLPEMKNPELLKYRNTHIDYYVVLQGDKPPEMDKYELFNKWTLENGVIWPKVKWPVWFDDEYAGVQVLEDIENREAFALIPYKIILSCRRTREHPILGAICKKYPSCFEEGKADDWEQLTLTLAVLYEMTLGLKS